MFVFLLMNQGNGRGSFKKMKKAHLGGLGSGPGRSLNEKAPSPPGQRQRLFRMDHELYRRCPTDGTVSAAYDYLAHSPLMDHITFKNGATARMTTTKQYDYLDRLASISSAGGSTVSFGYGYNQVNQRTGPTLADGSFWEYAYDALGQVISGKRHWSDGTPVAGQESGGTWE